MAAIAKWRCIGAFAAAQPNSLIFSQREFLRRELAAFVAAVAERLVFRLATGAPPVISGFEFLGVGRFLRDDGFHRSFLFRVKVVEKLNFAGQTFSGDAIKAVQ
mgnify:FL=1